MGSSHTLVVAILALALATYLGHVEANYYEDTHFTWGANHSSISNKGNDPNRQGMKLYSSLWNADDWATQGGRKKIDWNCAPFLAKYRQFKARACQWEGPFSVYRCSAPTPANWWTSSTYKQLSYSKQGQMKWIRDHYMIYDYCKDTERFQGKLPSECSKPQY